MSTTTRLWRTAPRWEGLCSDGWFQTPDGRFRSAEDPPLITTVAIDGKEPTQEQVDVVRRDLAKAPRSVIADLRRRGVRIEIIPGVEASLHPAAAGIGKCKGFAYSGLAVIAAEHGFQVLHEIGHLFDDVRIRGGRFSSLPEWRKIHEHLPPGVFERDYYRSDEMESFAEIFAKCFHGPVNRAMVPEEARRFIEWTVAGV